MKNAKTLSLLLAATINLIPLARLGITTTQVCLRPTYAVVFQWTGISAALLGSYDAVSGASTFITSPSKTTGKVGEEFSYRITSAPDQGNVFRADPLPPGLSLGTTKRTRSFISGIPTEPGTFTLTIVASDDNRPSRTISKTLTITIEADVLPVSLLSAPLDQDLETGQDLFLSILATGTGPLSYQWYHRDEPLANQTEPVLKIRNVEEGNSGNYHVRIENSISSVLSDPVMVNVTAPVPELPPRVSSIALSPDGIELEITGTPGATLRVEASESIDSQEWQALQTVALPAGGKASITDPSSNLASRYYRVRSN